MDHFKTIYARQAAEYHRMIAAEDVDGNLPAAIRSLAPLDGKRLLDLGSGTGRLALLFGPQAGELLALDLSLAMLRHNQAQRSAAGGRWSLVQGDMRRLPVPDGWAEVTFAGWAIGHMRSWFASGWQTHIGQALAEMQRVTAAGGHLFVIETLGTGSLSAAPPVPELGEYYAWLENEWGFERYAIRTDYQFGSVEEAVRHTEFFFGPGLGAQIRERGWARLPEWTGVWHRRR